jgi:hypothetical protein
LTWEELPRGCQIRHPWTTPEPAFFVDTGVHFALDTYRAGFVVTDGHHNRVLFVDGTVK